MTPIQIIWNRLSPAISGLSRAARRRAGLLLGMHRRTKNQLPGRSYSRLSNVYRCHALLSVLHLYLSIPSELESLISKDCRKQCCC